MGNFYVTFAVRGVERTRVSEVLRATGRTAFVGATTDGWTIFCDEEADRRSGAMDGLAEKVSAQLDTVVLAVLNHDDDILMYSLYAAGEFRDTYDSSPGYFDGEVQPPSGGDAFELAAACGIPKNSKLVESVLQGEYVFAVERHQALAKLLGMPWPLACTGYRYLQSGNASEFERIP